MDNEVEAITSRLSERFWNIVERSKTDWPGFLSALQQLDPHSLWQLYWTYRAAMGVLRRAEYEAYADPDLVEDGLDDLAGWIVAQGKDFYMDIVHNPERMPPDTPEDAYPNGYILSEISRIPHPTFSTPEDDSYFFQ